VPRWEYGRLCRLFTWRKGQEDAIEGIFELNVGLLAIVFRTFVVYVAVVLGLRFFGKRELGQMTPFDLVVILTLSNAVQNAMTGPDTTLTGGLVSAVTLLASNWLLTKLGMKVPWVRKWVEGEPSLLVQKGHIYYDKMKQEGVEMDELLMAAREHGVDRISDIDKAVLEVDGTISVVPKDTVGSGSKTRRRRRVHR
jgi:uncharacterized membrane protein YcaP (DUF421 family)